MSVFKKMLFLSFVLCAGNIFADYASSWKQETDKNGNPVWYSRKGQLAAGSGLPGSRSNAAAECAWSIGVGAHKCEEPCQLNLYCCADPAYVLCNSTPVATYNYHTHNRGCTPSSIQLGELVTYIQENYAKPLCSTTPIPNLGSIFGLHGFLLATKNSSELPITNITAAIPTKDATTNCYNYCSVDSAKKYSINLQLNGSPSSGESCTQSTCQNLASNYQFLEVELDPCSANSLYTNCPNNYCNTTFPACPATATLGGNTPNCYSKELCSQYCAGAQGATNPMCVCNSWATSATTGNAANFYSLSSCASATASSSNGSLSDSSCQKPGDYWPNTQGRPLIDAQNEDYKACNFATYVGVSQLSSANNGYSSVSSREALVKKAEGIW